MSEEKFRWDTYRLEGSILGALFAVALGIALGFVLGSCTANAECPPQGDSPRKNIQTLDLLKNRAGPIPPVVLSVNMLTAILTPGEDSQRFNQKDAARITGYVDEVKDGGTETANCHASDEAHRDTHIAIVASAAEAGVAKRRIIVEVTPRFKALHEDWTTIKLRQRLLHRTATFTGFLFFDAEHKQNALNTNPSGRDLWRATCWELHPVFDIEVNSE